MATKKEAAHDCKTECADLYKQLDGDNIEAHNTIESTIINNDVLQTINTEVIDTISDDDSEININTVFGHNFLESKPFFTTQTLFGDSKKDL